MSFTRWQDVMIYLVSEELTDQDNPIDWIAKRLGKARSKTYGYYEGRGCPDIEEARDLHEDLVEKYECHAVMSFLNHEFSVKGGVANGTAKDDFWEIIELSTDGARLFKKAKKGCATAKQKFKDKIQAIKSEAKDLEAEWRRL